MSNKWMIRRYGGLIALCAFGGPLGAAIGLSLPLQFCVGFGVGLLWLLWCDAWHKDKDQKP